MSVRDSRIARVLVTMCLCLCMCLCSHSAQASGQLNSPTIESFSLEISPLQPKLPILAKYQFSLENQNSFYLTPALRTDFAALGDDDEFGDFSEDSDFEESQGFQRVSTIRAVALSTLLPGAGQWYIGNKRAARLFLGAEAGIWAGFAALKVYAGWKQDDLERFATLHAGVSGFDQDEQFFRQLSFYSSREEYNSLGRAFDPDLPFIPDTPESDWNWDSQVSRSSFRQLLNGQKSADRNADFMFVAALVNRLTSAALAWRSARKHNSQLEDDSDEFGAVSPGKSKADLNSNTTFRLIQPRTGHNGSDGLMLAFTHSF